MHNVRAYLRECLDSILDQPFGDFELIAVDDASPDGSGEILDEYAARDSRVHVLHLSENVGLGGARNAGMDAATGRYLLFVDSDDSLVPHTLGAIAERLTVTDYPDVLMFDYARVYWPGNAERNVMSHALAQDGPDVFTADQRPDLLRVLMVAWNKAYRREFIEQRRFRFPPGYYEDLPWTYPTLISAQRVAVLDRVCYNYRQRRHGNILRSQSRRHFEVFDQYDRVFAYLDSHPELESWRLFLFDRMLTHALSILRARNRIHKSLRREFFEHLVAAYDRLKPADYDPASGPGGAKLRAVAAHNYPAFDAAHVAGTAVRSISRIVARTRHANKPRVVAAKRSVIHAFYQTELHKPVDENLAVYASYWGRGYSGNPKAIYETAKDLAPHVRGVWVVKKQHVDAMPPGVEYVKQGSIAYFRVMARAKYLINDVNFPDEIVKRPGTIHLQTNHGTPLKKMGLQLLDYPLGAANMDFEQLLHRCDRWDYLLSSNRFSSEVWERAYPCDYVTLETGYPRNDRLVLAGRDERLRVRQSLGLTEDKRVILYAPTFRDWSRDRFDPAVDLAALCARLGESYVVLVRGHYFTRSSEQLDRLHDAGLLRDVSMHRCVEDLMIASDVLLTDYSSIMFDYANLDRPIVIFADDWQTYSRVRGANFDLLAEPPGIVEQELEGLVDAFVSGRVNGPQAAAQRKEFRRRFCQFDDGYAAQRVVRMILLGEHPPTAVGVTHGTGAAQEGVDSNEGAAVDTGLRSGQLDDAAAWDDLRDG